MKLDKNTNGSVLIMTLLITALLVAILVEFAYGVFVKTNVLYNFRDGQNLSLIAQSGIELADGYIKDYLASNQYTAYASYVIPVAKITDNSTESLVVSITDENAKFNINTIINENGTTNEKALSTFKRLLTALKLDENISLYVTNWISSKAGSSSGLSDSTSHNYLYCVDELLSIPQITPEIYKKLAPFVTANSDGLININTASEEVLMALDENITQSTAKEIIEYREKTSPFKTTAGIQSAPAMADKSIGLMGKITVKSTVFSVTSVAALRGIQREIHAVTQYSETPEQVKYWKEF
ncbi:type II secretion system minor pseudopilin GspK [Candidatus Magnetomonas plexicatena]|uniref:type II secretion system minor pseudopilin GspK n=1 Tax=Candidatus Magnetomonas plexicatena TaxID=2552947 RepID=UPI001C755677|nr:type II secretion system minor pseudopilin GspK [Nitrospirales bacterium LBB_01]